MSSFQSSDSQKIFKIPFWLFHQWYEGQMLTGHQSNWNLCLIVKLAPLVLKITISRVKHVFLAENLVKTVNFVKDFKFVYFDILGKIAYSNDDNSATVSKSMFQANRASDFRNHWPWLSCWSVACHSFRPQLHFFWSLYAIQSNATENILCISFQWSHLDSRKIAYEPILLFPIRSLSKNTHYIIPLWQRMNKPAKV